MDFLLRDQAATLVAASLLFVFIMIKRDRAFGFFCAAEFACGSSIAVFIYPFFNFYDPYDYSAQMWFVFLYGLKDFVFILILSRLATPTKFYFMLILFVSMLYNYYALIELYMGHTQAFNGRQLVMRTCIALQLTSMVFTLVKGDDDCDNSGGIRKRLHRLLLDNEGLLWRKSRKTA